MKWGSMKRKKSGQRALVAYLCHFRPEPESGFTLTCPKLPPCESAAGAVRARSHYAFTPDGKSTIPPPRVPRRLPAPRNDDPTLSLRVKRSNLALPTGIIGSVSVLLRRARRAAPLLPSGRASR